MYNCIKSAYVIHLIGQCVHFILCLLDLDDSFAFEHSRLTLPSTVGTSGTKHSWIADGTLIDTSTNPSSIGGTAIGNNLPSSTNEMVTVDTKNTYTLTYTGSTLTLVRTFPTANTLVATDATNAITNINNLFVNSAQNQVAFWEICGLGKSVFQFDL